MNLYMMKDGKPVRTTAAEWAQSYKDSAEDRRVALDEIDGIKVSTVFLGIDHSFGLGGPPVLWETMIFGGVHDDYCERYTSRTEAEAGQRAAVDLVKRSIGC